MKGGFEAEYWVVDADGALTAGYDLAAAHELATPEFVDSLIEIRTPAVEHSADLAREFRTPLRAVLAAAETTDRHLLPLGTPLAQQTGSITSKRGSLLEAMYGDDIEPATNCAGTRLHFDRRTVLRQLNVLTALDPALALVNSSPYYRGMHLADSSRAYAYRRLSGARASLGIATSGSTRPTSTSGTDACRIGTRSFGRSPPNPESVRPCSPATSSPRTPC